MEEKYHSVKVDQFENGYFHPQAEDDNTHDANILDPITSP